MSILTPPLYLAYAASIIILAHVIPYLYDYRRLRSYPGPILAKFTDLWLAKYAKQGIRSLVVHRMHDRYGPIVRIAPNHVSIASSEALNIVYAHGNGCLKSDFYDAFVSIRRGIFNTRDRTEHTRKRKMVAHVFSSKNVFEFEPHIQRYVGGLVTRWKGLLAQGEGAAGPEGDSGWSVQQGYLRIDLLPWVNYLAFDIIGDLAFGTPFGMIDAGKDEAHAPISTSPKYLRQALTRSPSEIQYKKIPAVKILTGRGDYSASMGALPTWVRPLVKSLVPWYRQGTRDVDNLAGIAVVAVAKRLAAAAEECSDGDGLAELEGMYGEERVDLLSKLRHGRDENGDNLSLEELTAEALTLLIAGSDTTANSICAILFYLAQSQVSQKKLQEDLDALFGPPSASFCSESPITTQSLKHLPYLDACINEGFRVHSTSSLGLPRVVPEGGLTILGHHFREGTVLSVPSYSIHRDKETWGEDAEVYRPERWLEGGMDAKKHREVAFNPFSTGPRGCVGKNLAFLELQIIVANLLYRYDLVLADPQAPMETREGFLRKPVSCFVGLKFRD